MSLLLLDDIFSALDTKTSVTLWNRVFCSDLLQYRTVILVTQLSWVVAEADASITLENGRVQCLEHKVKSSRTPKTVELGVNKDVQEQQETRADNEEKMDTSTTKSADAGGHVLDAEAEQVTGVDKEAAGNGASSSLSCKSSSYDAGTSFYLPFS